MKTIVCCYTHEWICSTNCLQLWCSHSAAIFQYILPLNVQMCYIVLPTICSIIQFYYFCFSSVMFPMFYDKWIEALWAQSFNWLQNNKHSNTSTILFNDVLFSRNNYFISLYFITRSILYGITYYLCWSASMKIRKYWNRILSNKRFDGHL